MTTFASDRPFNPETSAAAPADAREPASSAEHAAGVPEEFPLEVSAQREDSGAVILQVRGSVDQTTTPAFKRAVLNEVRAGAGVLVLDLSGTTFLCVSGVEALATLRHAADLKGTQIMWVTGGNPAVRRAMRAARLAATETLAGHLGTRTEQTPDVPNIPVQQGGRA